MARSTRVPSRSSFPIPPTAASRTGWRGRSGRSVRATRRSSTATRRSPSFLRDRLDLALAAVERQVLDRYGEWLDIDGVAVPAWLIMDGADATGEAVLGLAAYVGGDRRRRAAVLQQLGEGVAGDAVAATRAPGRSAPCCPGRGPRRSGTHGGRWRRPGWPGVRGHSATGRMRGAALSDPPPSRHTCYPAGPGERVAALARPSASRSPTAPTAGSVAARRGRAATGPACACRRHRRGMVLRRQPGRRGDVRPLHRPNLRRHREGRQGQPQLRCRVDHPRPAHHAHPRPRGRPRRSRDGGRRRRASDVDAGRSRVGNPGVGATRYQPASAWTGESLWSGSGRRRPASPGGTLNIPVTGAGAEPADAGRAARPGGRYDDLDDAPRRVAGVIRHARVGPQGDSPARACWRSRRSRERSRRGIGDGPGQPRRHAHRCAAGATRGRACRSGNRSHATALLRSFARTSSVS